MPIAPVNTKDIKEQNLLERLLLRPLRDQAAQSRRQSFGGGGGINLLSALSKAADTVAPLVVPEDPVDAATDLVGPLAAVERVGGKAAKGLAGESADAFRRWFGKSKVVDEAGEPLRVYHGTDQSFDVFDVLAGKKTQENHPSAALGAFFTADPDIAGVYTGYAKKSGGIGGNVMPAYVRVENPYYMPAAEMMGLDTFRKVAAKKRELIKKGHDGIVQAGVEGLPDTEMRQIIAFDPTQIKSATGNRGTFDPSDPNITHALTPAPLMRGLARARRKLEGEEE